MGHYYPLAIMSEKLVGYLNSALIKGDMVQAQVLINGDLDKFPFVDNSGTFIVDGEIENTTFQFISCRLWIVHACHNDTGDDGQRSKCALGCHGGINRTGGYDLWQIGIGNHHHDPDLGFL